MNSALSNPEADSFFDQNLTDRQNMTRSRSNRFRWLRSPRTIALLLTAGFGLIGATYFLGDKLATTDAKTLGRGQDSTAVVVSPWTVKYESGYQKINAYTGIIRPAQETLLAFEMPGTVEAVLAKDGGEVTKGQIIATLDVRLLNAQKKEIEAQLNAGISLLEELQAGPRQQTIGAAEARLREAEADLKLAEQNFTRESRLIQTNAISQDSFDKTKFGLAAANARVDAARLVLDELKAGTRKEQIAAQSAKVEQLKAALEQIEVRLTDAKLTAPFDGTIVERMVDEGASVSPQAPVFRVVQLAPLEVWFGIPTSVAHSLQVGAEHSLQYADDVLHGNLQAILPEVDPKTRTQTVIYRIDRVGQRKIPTGELARIEFSSSVNERGFWVPHSSLTRGPRGLWSVFVIQKTEGQDFKLAKSEVEVLFHEPNRAFVRGPVSDGAQIVAGGTHRLVSGQFCRLEKESL